MAVAKTTGGAGGASGTGDVRPRLAGRERLVGVDVARGIAILGVFIAHMGVPLVAFALGPEAVEGAGSFAIIDYSGAGATGTVAGWVETAVSGRSAALFAFLAGISLILVAGRHRPDTREERNRARVRVAARAIALIVLGYALATLGSLAVILHFYGLYFLLAIPLLWLRRRYLAAVGAAFLLLGPLLVTGVYSSALPWGSAFGAEESYDAEWEAEWDAKWDDPEWVAEQEALDAKWEARADDPEWVATYEAEQEASDAKWEAEMAEGFADKPLFALDYLESPAGLLVTGIYPAVVFMAYVIAGMLVARLDLRATRVRLGLVAGGVGLAVTGYGSSFLLLGPLSSLLPGGGEDVRYVDLLSADSHANTTLEVIGNTGVAMAVLGLCLLAADRAGRLPYPLAAAGAMTLTLYTAHGVGLWALERVIAPDASWAEFLRLHSVDVFILVGLVFAVLWRRYLGAGPLERPVSWISRTTARRFVPAPATVASESAGTSDLASPSGSATPSA
ncbi:uncharacterized protein DUF1624 [Nocardiopsis sp. Huas11]|uniref:heparan-alpha-glucosaminide N-acetyltransferase domain-containing protein n=1 Tax=Nocardiopsis sp. Huas11 TaxID=2183912 RepID=UPI000EB2420B|nr:heparan-alpha-glucosaminide N-acetyltransferase domain-containing protein [Nocardiopsis sp. Huas11]RKS07571.1 uncharacterized protein DUF1624 [Nocardiopsis sp. Huas11]